MQVFVLWNDHCLSAIIYQSQVYLKDIQKYRHDLYTYKFQLLMSRIHILKCITIIMYSLKCCGVLISQ